MRRPIAAMAALTATGVALLLAGCASTPLGPTVQIVPAKDKPFQQFATEQAYCKNYAAGQVQGEAEHANTIGAGTAVVGTLLGAGLGAAVGGGSGAAIGAASGAAVGTGLGAGNSASQQGGIQGQYDNAYAQCMVSYGNQVVVPQILVQPAPYVVQPAPYYAPAPAPYYQGY
ncbi:MULTISPECIES: glycine zipper family protein [unclassified Acidisoma]|jgi:hypothetical protein|uniref:glycine zipper family protein n=1 Tax=unclassified Acidisoma TaxID=2634065 RepID=UPI0020B155A9|nr:MULTISPECIES: glycine zipper family protein [unclassified Acidisoma]